MPGAIDMLDVGFALVDDSGAVVAACPKYTEMVGRPLGGAVGLKLEDCTHPADLETVRFVLRQAYAGGGVANLRKRYIRPDGSFLWVEQRLLYLEGGGRRFLLLSVHPVICTPSHAKMASPAPGLADYVVDMSMQLSAMAVAAQLPVTCDLLGAASRAAKEEGGEGGTVDAAEAAP